MYKSTVQLAGSEIIKKFSDEFEEGLDFDYVSTLSFKKALLLKISYGQIE